MSLLAELAETTRSIASSVGAAVVRIGRHGGRGCGVVVGQGVVVTNAHNLRGSETTVTFAGGRETSGRVTAVDVDGDLAVVEVDTGDAPAVVWADERSDVGDPVFAVSRGPAGHHRVSFGLVSATERAFRGPRGRRITGTVEHTAPLTRGSSGSPIVDSEGRLIGLNTNRLGDGFYLALPADDDLRQRLDALRTGAAPRRPRLAIGLAPPEVARRLRASVGLPERDGLLVRSVETDGPADRAGIKQGDLVVAAAGTPVRTPDDLYDALDAAGDSITIRVVRGVEEHEIEVAFGAGESATD